MRPDRVYPRVYGGTSAQHPDGWSGAGLSPRVRGNLLPHDAVPVDHGSIPACTGEPIQAQSASLSRAVYPRVYGGTSARSRAIWIGAGLSPRVRGNRLKCSGLYVRMGSIPACTGEPRRPARVSARPTVYPRVYGGTPSSKPSRLCIGGLSPRVRGNPTQA